MGLLAGWDEILESLEAQRKRYGGSSIGESALAISMGYGFRFPDEESARELVKQFEARAASMKRRGDLIRKALDAFYTQFADDAASISYLKKARASLVALEELNNSAFRYASRYVEKIEKAIESKAADEATISEVASRIGSRLA